MVKKDYVWLGVLIIVVLGINLWFQHYNLMPPSDGTGLVKQAESFRYNQDFIVNGKPQTADPIGYSVFLGIWASWFGFSFFSTKIFSIIAGCVSLVPFYYLARKFVRPMTAWFVVLLFSVNLLVLMYFSESAPWALVLCFFMFAMFYLSKKNYFMFSLFFGLAALVRYELIFVFVFYVLLWAVNKRIKLRTTFFCCVIFLLCISPWMIKNEVYSGNPLYISQFKYFGVDSTPITASGTESATEHLGVLGTGVQFCKTAFVTFFWKLPQAVNPLIFMFVILGLFFSCFWEIILKLKFFWPFFFSYLGIFFVVGFVEQQYLIPIIPLFFIMFGYIVDLLFTYKKVIFFVGVFCVMFMPVLGYVYQERPEYLQEPVEYKFAGEWLANQSPGRILAVKPQFWYYSGNTWEWIPDVDSLGELSEYMLDNDFRYLVYDERWGVVRRPQFKFLLDDFELDNFMRVYDDKVSDYEVVIYEVVAHS